MKKYTVYEKVYSIMNENGGVKRILYRPPIHSTLAL